MAPASFAWARTHMSLSLSPASPALLLLSTATVMVAWQLPYGPIALYPLSLLATFAHEMGHGLTALLLGEHFDRLLLFADGSGLAQWRGTPGRLARALIAAGGLLGPSLAGLTLLLCAGSPQRARLLLGVLALGLVLCVVGWVRNAFAIAFLLTLAVAFGAVARWCGDLLAAFLLHLIAAVLCLSWFRDLDYMFAAQVVVDGVAYPSDSAAIGAALWLPHWVWGTLIAAMSLLFLLLGLWAVARRWRNG